MKETMVVPGGALSGAGAALMAAAVSYLFTSLHTLRTEQHKDLVGRVGDQLKEFYGPLLACITASKESCAYSSPRHSLPSVAPTARTIVSPQVRCDDAAGRLRNARARCAAVLPS